MARKTLLQLLADNIACKDPQKLRHPVSGKCVSKNSRVFSPKYELSNGRYVLKEKKVQERRCPPGQRYEPVKEICIPYKQNTTRKTKQNCKYGIDQLTGRCASKPSVQIMDGTVIGNKIAKHIIDKRGVSRVVYVL